MDLISIQSIQIAEILSLSALIVSLQAILPLKVFIKPFRGILNMSSNNKCYFNSLDRQTDRLEVCFALCTFTLYFAAEF